MERLQQHWGTLPATSKGVLVASAIALTLAVAGLVRMAVTPELSLLYAGLDSEAAGTVLAELDNRAVAYEVRGDDVYVPAADRDALRIAIAAEGLPANGAAGYEILDSLSGFGTTSQMFDAAYWRAKEGELARTILANPSVQRARVHIAASTTSPFSAPTEISASITITPNGQTVPAPAAEAFRHLVASAVGGLSPDNVVVIDAATGRILGESGGASGVAVGREQADAMKANVYRLLSARVGPGNVVVEVNVEPVDQSEIIRERKIDPESRVAISTNTEETTVSEQNEGAVGVTVASNLPDGDGANEGPQSQRQNSETRSVTNFDVSETTREIEISPGGVKRLSVAVLVNEAALDADGAVRDAELERLTGLVAAAVGLDEARGDQLTIEALPFSDPAAMGSGPRKTATIASPLSIERLAKLGTLAAVALVLGLFVIRPLLRSDAPAQTEALASFDAANAALLINPESEIAEGPQEANADQPFADTPRLAGPSGEPVPPSSPEFAKLKDEIAARQNDTLAVLKSWLEDDRKEVA